MNPLAHYRAAVEQMQTLETWQAWKLGERESIAVQLDNPDGLQSALDQAVTAIALHRGDTLAVLCEHGGRRANTLWLYTIKQESKLVWRRDPISGETVKTQRLYPVLIAETAVEAFVPVRRFDAFTDDPVGIDRQLIQGGQA